MYGTAQEKRTLRLSVNGREDRWSRLNGCRCQGGLYSQVSVNKLPMPNQDVDLTAEGGRRAMQFCCFV